MQDLPLFLEERKQELQRKRKEIEGKRNSRKIGPVERNGDGMELGFRATEVHRNSSENAMMEKILISIDAGLRAMEQGSYHLCVGCGKEIEAERMKTVFFPQRCAGCAKNAT